MFVCVLAGQNAGGLERKLSAASSRRCNLMGCKYRLTKRDVEEVRQHLPRLLGEGEFYPCLGVTVAPAGKALKLSAGRTTSIVCNSHHLFQKTSSSCSS